jgi:hypothetical protein
MRAAEDSSVSAQQLPLHDATPLCSGPTDEVSDVAPPFWTEETSRGEGLKAGHLKGAHGERVGKVKEMIDQGNNNIPIFSAFLLLLQCYNTFPAILHILP